MKPLPCPGCKSSIVWKSVEPRKSELICQRCGLVSPAPVEEHVCQWGLLEGEWEALEIHKVEQYIKSGPTDWTFVKGRRMWCAFRNCWPAQDVIATVLLDDLLYWVEIAIRSSTTHQNLNWRQLYIQNLGKR